MTKPPSRTAGYQGVTRDLVAIHGMVCFLCGHKHATVHTLQADPINRDKPFDIDNLIVACKPCAKRRNGKPIGAYWNERLSAAATEIAHIKAVGLNKEVIMNLREAYAPRITTPNAVGITGVTDEPKPEFDEDLGHLSREQQREVRAAPGYLPPSARAANMAEQLARYNDA
jgi:hypothetical protein